MHSALNCTYQARNQRGGNRAIAPRNFHKRMYLLGAATSYIILTPPRKYQLVAALVLTLSTMSVTLVIVVMPQPQSVRKLP